MDIKAWVLSVGASQGRVSEAIVDCLRLNGVDVQIFTRYGTHGPGVVLFRQIDGDICDVVRDASRNRNEYVLAGCLEALSAETARQLVRAGASDVLCCNEPNQAAQEIRVRLQRWEEVNRLISSTAVRHMLVGESQAWKQTLRQVAEVAHYTDAPVLIQGESGTGKELVARLVHALDARPAKRDLIILDCSTIVPELSGSEFFGHERGAFTGAVSARDGAFALADGGTLFLDEVGELPSHLQTQLLRVIQEHAFKRVGGNAWQRSSFRLVCATNRDLWAHVQRGEFRADLYFRLAGFVCTLVPLRERREDILPLVRRFLEESAPDEAPLDLDAPVQEYLLKREYPGNVRELKQVVGRMLCRHAGGRLLTAGCVPPHDLLACGEDGGEWRDQGFEFAVRRALGSRTARCRCGEQRGE
ncbi:MAG: sigma 54-interacting transcriptional regulator [Gammaproteobacteria bacterium]